MSLGPENSASSLHTTDEWLSPCIRDIETQVAFLDAAADCVK